MNDGHLQRFARVALVLLGGLGSVSAAPAVEAELREVRQATARAEEQIALLKAEIRDSKRALAELTEDYAGYRDDYRRFARIKAVGDFHERLSCRDGREFQEVTVREVDAVGLAIHHRNGSARIAYQLLPASFQERFQWQAGEARTALAREAEISAERQRLATLAHERREERMQIAAVESRKLEEARLSAEKSRLAALAAAASSNRLGSSYRLGATRTVGSGNSSRYYRSSSRYDRPRYRGTTIYYYPVSPRTIRPRGVPYAPPNRPTTSPRQQQRQIWNRVRPRTTFTPGPC